MKATLIALYGAAAAIAASTGAGDSPSIANVNAISCLPAAADHNGGNESGAE
jgi:hypothetical protein